MPNVVTSEVPSFEFISILTLLVLSVEVFMADFDGFDFAVKSLAAFDFAALFRTFFGVDVAFAAFEPDLSRD